MSLPSFYTQGAIERSDRSSYRRDTYHCARYPDLDGQTDRVRCASAIDRTPIFTGHYQSQCPCCWLNQCHTEAVHAHYVPSLP
jgi:hypothetical protein